MTAGADPHPVGTPITNGVRTVNFFNGRLLTAEDLRREQDANRALRERLGLAVGDGVVTGLRVRLPLPVAGDPAQPVVEVTEGVAVNRAGAALRLPYTTRVSLAKRPAAMPAGSPAAGSVANGSAGSAVNGSAAGGAVGGGFAACSGLAAGAPLTVSGVYVLTVAPAGAPVGRAPVSGLGNLAAGCNTDACAEGVVFRVCYLNLNPALLTAAARPWLRNRLAHLMFGTADPRRARLARDPFGSTLPGHYGLLDDLRANHLTDDEVPLACMLWTPGVGIEFVDEWSVRRRVATRGLDSDWPELTGGRRHAEAEAAFLQFQAQAADLAGRPGATQLPAADHFVFLPPAGFLPLAASPATPGFAFQRFFAGLPHRDPSVIDGTEVDGCMRESFEHDPIELARKEVLWLYLVRQNRNVTRTAPPTSPFLLFTSAHLRYRADARFDVAYWNFGNFAEIG